MNELISLEKKVGMYVTKSRELQDENKELLKLVNRLRDENEILRNKNEELENKLVKSASERNNTEKYFSDDERESLKKAIDGLIKNIDLHLRS